MDAVEYDNLKENWARWARCHEGPRPNSCKSLESLYSHPSWTESKRPSIEYNLKDAEWVESILTGQTFPKHLMRCIVYANVFPWANLHMACRKISKGLDYDKIVRPDNFKHVLAEADMILFNRMC